jgi:hypothetical protein
VGAWLARDKDTAVLQVDHLSLIAGKPRSHRRNAISVGAGLARDGVGLV